VGQDAHRFASVAAGLEDAAVDAVLLKKFALFSNLSPTHLKMLAPHFRPERHPEGKVLFREGDPGDSLFLIAKGNVRITQQLQTSTEEALAVLKAGDYFGDMSLIDAHPRSADAIVGEDCLLFVISREEFLRMLRRDAEFTVSVMFQFVRTLCSRLRTNNDKIRAFNVMAMW
jgi:CRP-like cAMP-binding protein